MFGRTYLELLHDLLHFKHIEDPENGYCITCASPRRFHPCPVRERIVSRLVELDHLNEDEQKDLLRGDRPCPCGKNTAYFAPT